MMSNHEIERKITIIIDSNLEDVAVVGAATNKLCATLPIAELVCRDIELSVCEAVNNAVLHAYEKERGHKVEVTFTVTREKLTIDVCDNGKKMSDNALPASRCVANSREEISETGMGLLIITEIMDKVVYRTRNDRNILSMTRSILPYHASK
jgi:serine/threonine-protein kinase RsbW